MLYSNLLILNSSNPTKIVTEKRTPFLLVCPVQIQSPTCLQPLFGVADAYYMSSGDVNGRDGKRLFLGNVILCGPAKKCRTDMPSSKKNKRKRPERPTIHPRNKYSDNPPDFSHLASLYPSFKPFVFYSRDGRPRIDWTDFNSTRELTRILLLHDHHLEWWIPDGQLCPTVPNRSNYIHWIEDLLLSDIVPKSNSTDVVKGFDIGTGANCIYPLLGASLLGWSFVGSDVTDVALEWAEKNVRNNPHISDLIEIRKVLNCENTVQTKQVGIDDSANGKCKMAVVADEETSPLSSSAQPAVANEKYHGPPILVGVVRDGENFDFCMCNPPFFEDMVEAGLNPKTACGGTREEMVCPGGEKAFITRIIEDSVVLKGSFRWFSSMVGRKTNLKFLSSKLREVGVTIVKTTEFVQGQTCRWGLAWSFMPPARKLIAPQVAEKNVLSFTLEGIQRQFSAMHVLQYIETFLCSTGGLSKLNASSFTVDITASYEQCDKILKQGKYCGEPGNHHPESVDQEFHEPNYLQPPLNNLCARISVFQQIPGTLLVKGSLQHKDSPLSGIFSSIIQQLEETLRHKFCRARAT